ncbi:DUF5819 family protein [Gracilibacillus suaedae]|uniref:DUF5819 family protein n=1 Tax=Gracilibacillus suaedae TaxID=2820273 RepID=UPI0038B30953
MKYRVIIFVIFTVLITFHTTMTIVYNFPVTPFKNKVDPIVNLYMNPLFTQRWTLFAPTPANTNWYVNTKSDNFLKVHQLVFSRC